MKSCYKHTKIHTHTQTHNTPLRTFYKPFFHQKMSVRISFRTIWEKWWIKFLINNRKIVEKKISLNLTQPLFVPFPSSFPTPFPGSPTPLSPSPPDRSYFVSSFPLNNPRIKKGFYIHAPTLKMYHRKVSEGDGTFPKKNSNCKCKQDMCSARYV